MPQAGASVPPPPSLTFDAKTESFFASLVEPQCGHLVPFHFEDRTSTSLSWLQWLQ